MGKQPMQKSPHHRPARAGKMTVTRCGTAVAPSPFTRKVGLDRIQAALARVSGIAAAVRRAGSMARRSLIQNLYPQAAGRRANPCQHDVAPCTVACILTRLVEAST